MKVLYICQFQYNLNKSDKVYNSAMQHYYDYYDINGNQLIL